jgi:hypothetical protein
LGDASRLRHILGFVCPQKKNRSSTTRFVVAVKVKGKFKEIKTVGIARDEAQIDLLYKEGKLWVDNHANRVDLFQQHTRENEEALVTNMFLSIIENILHNGPNLYSIGCMTQLDMMR